MDDTRLAGIRLPVDMRYDVSVPDTQTKERREDLTFRISPAGRKQLDDIAEAEGRTRSDVIRRLLAEGIRNWQRKTGAQ